MGNPWDPLPLPRDGDLDDRLTYEWVGRNIDRWEQIEFTLARVHSVFAGDPDGSAALRAYGVGRTVPERDAIIRAAAEKWFAKNPNQRQEGQFDKFMQGVVGFSDRRNEIAHGVVHQVSGLIFFRQRTTRADYLVQYAVIPAYHVMRRFHSNGVPKYMYGTPEMTVLCERLMVLQLSIWDFLHEINPP
jgi:hypothetical protein